MAWIKRNLLFVVGLAVSVALLGAGVFYLSTTMDEADRVNAELDAKNQQLDGLVKREPYPNSENIEKVKEEQKRVEAFKKDARARFGRLVRPESLDNASFKSLLEATIAGLTRQSERMGVKLPEKYDFTFAEQRKNLQLATNTLAPLATQLNDLDNICRVLFDAKIHSLLALKRSGVASGEAVGSADLLTKKVGTNALAGASIHPYEISFQCFSTELGNVLAGFLNSPQAYVLKTINVERGSTSSTTDPNAAAVASGPVPGRPGMDMAMARRYGLMGGGGNRYGQPQPQAQVAAPAPTRAGETVLEEKPLRVTIGLEVVKFAVASVAPVTEAPTKPTSPSAR